MVESKRRRVGRWYIRLMETIARMRQKSEVAVGTRKAIAGCLLVHLVPFSPLFLSSTMAKGKIDELGSLLLPFQRHILSLLIPQPDQPASTGNALLILARGLGLRSIIATLVRLLPTAPNVAC